MTASPVFQQVLGADFDRLPAPLRGLHQARGRQAYHGEVEVLRGRRWLARVLAWATRLPPAGRGSIRVDIETGPAGERWVRYVAGHAMASRLWVEDGVLQERLGLVRFGFRLAVDAEGAITWQVVRVHTFGWLPLPARWFSQVGAREHAQDGRYCFDVQAAMPLAGPLVHYRGWLDVG